MAISDWVEITQQQIDLFAECTQDDQWIHVDVERAKAGPFGAPIAHGFLTLSLLPVFFKSALRIEPAGMSVNYGLNKVRFTAPVPVGSRLRARFRLLSSELRAGGTTQTAWEAAIERADAAKPVCVAEVLVRHFPASA